MRIAVGADHAGFALKQELITILRDEGHEPIDLGTHSTDPVDYPDQAADVAHAVMEGRADRGLIVCGSGAGAAIAANKVPGIRCAQLQDTYTARQCVEHDDVNVGSLGARVVGIELARELVRTFLAARFSGEERHVRRLDKIKALEGRAG
jgi:RpiB/LacA/LacB family sugar-phosphate isomerase